MSKIAGMGQAKWQLEMRAYQAFERLMASADETRSLFEQAGLDLPEPLARFLGGPPADEGRVDEARMTVTPLPPPPRPPGTSDDWIWVPAADLTPQTLVIVLLRSHGPLSAKELQDKVHSYDPSVSLTSVYNIGARLDGKVIERTEAGWKLLAGAETPVLFEGAAWGPPKVFSRYEIAAHRRMVIRHLLSAAPDGMQVMQIVRHFQRDDLLWPPALGVVNKDLVEADLEKMASAKIVKRIGSQRKWVATGNTR